MKKNKLLYTLLSFSLFTPLISFAALGGIKDLFTSLKDIINLAFPVVAGLAVIFFFWGVGQFVLKDAGNDKTRDEGKQKMLWGVIALFVMFAIFGILRWISNTIDIPISTTGTEMI
jgi:TM2 domain-containing membrane protein YozV